MRSLLPGFFVIIWSLEMAPSTALARALENWPYERLFKESDLVVIAQTTTAEDCADTTTDNPWKVEFFGVITTFKIKAVLNGKPAGETIKVLHFRLKDGQHLKDGPLLVTFRTKGIKLDLKDGKVETDRPEYLLFLKASKDGRYEPASGRIDPELSVREMFRPLPADLDMKGSTGTKP